MTDPDLAVVSVKLDLLTAQLARLEEALQSVVALLRLRRPEERFVRR